MMKTSFTKLLTSAIFLLFIGIVYTPSITADNPISVKTIHVDDIDVKIYAGVNGRTQGRMGLGFAISICNNLNETINGTIEISSDNLRGQNVRFELWSFNFSAYHPPVILAGIDWVHFPFPIMSLTITVKVVDIVVSRSGIEIGPFVIFNQGED